MTTIIFAHPYHKSFNKRILDEVIKIENELNNDYHIIDLNKENFDPVLSETDLSLYSKGESRDAKVNEYIKILDKTSKIIIVFPIWWYDMPAILRGFFDKVMLNGSAFTEESDGLHPIRDIPQTYLLTTSAASSDDLINNFGDPINGTIIKATFPRIGFNNAVWLNCDSITEKSEKQLLDFIKEVNIILRNK